MLLMKSQHAAESWAQRLVHQKAGALETDDTRIQRCRQRMIGAHRAKGCDALRPSIKRATQQVFELANLVAAVAGAGQVIVLDRNVAST